MSSIMECTMIDTFLSDWMDSFDVVKLNGGRKGVCVFVCVFAEQRQLNGFNNFIILEQA